jgi:hypothetical protein
LRYIATGSAAGRPKWAHHREVKVVVPLVERWSAPRETRVLDDGETISVHATASVVFESPVDAVDAGIRLSEDLNEAGYYPHRLPQVRAVRLKAGQDRWLACVDLVVAQPGRHVFIPSPRPH